MVRTMWSYMACALLCFVSVMAIVFLGGVQIMVTGVASLYIGRILAEVQGRPVFVVRETYGGALRAFPQPILRETRGRSALAPGDVAQPREGSA